MNVTPDPKNYEYSFNKAVFAIVYVDYGYSQEIKRLARKGYYPSRKNCQTCGS